MAGSGYGDDIRSPLVTPGRLARSTDPSQAVLSDWFFGATAAPSVQPQRLEFWRPVALVALGFFAVDDDLRAAPTSIHSLRSPPAAVAQVRQPLWMHRAAVADQSVEADPPRTDHGWIHRYRFNFQTVGQSWLLWKKSSVDQSVEPDPGRVDHSRLLFGRAAPAVQVGQPWFLWSKARVDQEVEPDPVRVGYSARILFGRAPPSVAQPGQPWYLWHPVVPDMSVEPDAHRNNYSSMLFFKTEAPVVVVSEEWMIRMRRRHRR